MRRPDSILRGTFLPYSLSEINQNRAITTWLFDNVFQIGGIVPNLAPIIEFQVKFSPHSRPRNVSSRKCFAVVCLLTS